MDRRAWLLAGAVVVVLVAVAGRYGYHRDEEGAAIHRCAGPRGSWAARWDALRHYSA